MLARDLLVEFVDLGDLLLDLPIHALDSLLVAVYFPLVQVLVALVLPIALRIE